MLTMLEEILRRFGVFAVFASASVECDGTLVVAGVLAHLGMLALPIAIAAGTLGQLVGDSAWYVIGRRSAGAIRDTAAYRQVGPTVERLAAALGPAEILAARVVLGTRNASMLFWGMQRLPYLRFIAIDACGCLLWATALTTLGFFGSANAEAVLGEVEVVERWLLGAVVVAGVGALVAHRALRARYRKNPGASTRQ
jgi:membrane protein DedA with SNARE-associated domain